MDAIRVLVTPRSNNAKTGPILVTTSERSTCPTTCALRGAGCYAENGPLGFLWRGIDKTPAGQSFKNGTSRVQVRGWNDLLSAVWALPSRALWRHNQAGDLVHNRGRILWNQLRQLAQANKGRRGFTYTHHSMKRADNRRIVAETNAAGFTVNLSADGLRRADELAALAIAPVVVVLPTASTRNTVTPEGRKVIVCPATRADLQHKQITCATCGLCALATRDFIVGFPAHGARKKAAETIAATR